MAIHPVIKIHDLAPAKPPVGQPCNGCGICCMVAPCPVSALLLSHKEEACPALIWQAETAVYRCGMLLTPGRFCAWLPAVFNRPFIFLVRRWLALEIGCDSDAQVEISES